MQFLVGYEWIWQHGSAHSWGDRMWRRGHLKVQQGAQPMASRGYTRGFDGNTFGEEWIWRGQPLMTPRNLMLFYLSDLVKKRRFSDGSHNLTNSPLKWLSKDWKTSKPFKNSTWEKYTAYLISVIFSSFSAVSMTLKMPNARNIWARKSLFNGWAKSSLHPPDLVWYQWVIGEGMPESFRFLPAFLQIDIK